MMFQSASNAPDGHQAMPIADSWYEERTLHVANLKAQGSYPVIAVCQRCHRRIRLARLAQMEWAHVPVEPAIRGTAETA